MDTAYVYAPVYLEHDLPSHPENARRLQSILGRLEEAGLMSRLRLLEPRPATMEELERAHTPDLVAQVMRAAQAGAGVGHLDPDTYVVARSWDAALLAAGGLVRATEAVLAGEVANAFALARPPGHHATRTRAMGFCLFNNVAIAAQAALASGAARRVFIADFDVHHGNGTQDIFSTLPTVFYFSTHQFPLYPGSGHWSETGVGNLLNVPLPMGVGDRGYSQVFEELAWPLAERFQPDLILVSAGYDAHWKDPLAQMNLSLTGYAWLARELVHMATRLCGGRIVFALEGGYQLDVLAYGVLNTFYALLGDETVVDPFGPAPDAEPSVDGLIARIRAARGMESSA